MSVAGSIVRPILLLNFTFIYDAGEICLVDFAGEHASGADALSESTAAFALMNFLLYSSMEARLWRPCSRSFYRIEERWLGSCPGTRELTLAPSLLRFGTSLKGLPRLTLPIDVAWDTPADLLRSLRKVSTSFCNGRGGPGDLCQSSISNVGDQWAASAAAKRTVSAWLLLNGRACARGLSCAASADRKSGRGTLRRRRSLGTVAGSAEDDVKSVGRD
ncbi:hypothetical protein BDK51DRAFT_48433 [Blyttiomyces helicus]|uniref:Uncharacterized protein n=1 Tax=Blyttiomyces helicus TaxID=388810 RepID=A0A4P9W3A9_9FUNG|nr:hypothetical protein BDK51DRAFT_48433 [Blyttiomyces helicus]|eukprot:RKO86791.1 hypothetical protein BDK51DRAFT_48433 [Blyttiomyces helicus]